MYGKLYINTIIIIIIVLMISYYSLNIKTMYPQFVIELFNEPLGCLCVYMAVYLISFYNELIGLLCLIPVILLHLDIINLIRTNIFLPKQ